jgi:plasmid stabilization system protein ParE
MAPARLTISDPARQDLDEIWDNLAREASPEVADFVVARIYEAMYRRGTAAGLSQTCGTFRKAQAGECVQLCDILRRA